MEYVVLKLMQSAMVALALGVAYFATMFRHDREPIATEVNPPSGEGPTPHQRSKPNCGFSSMPIELSREVSHALVSTK